MKLKDSNEDNSMDVDDPVVEDMDVVTSTDVQMLNDMSSDNGSTSDDDDDYKPEATITFVVPNLSKLRGSALSPPVMIRGLPWKIMVMIRDGPRTGSRTIGFFLQCNAESESQAWSCQATAILRLKSQKEGVSDHDRKINHLFYHKENDWGYSSFMALEQLLDVDKGYCKDDTVIFEVSVTADAPHGVSWDSKKHTGFVGLKNQGATCYMNSLLQTLFFTNKLRKAVYQMPTENDDPKKCIAFSMQRVFYELQFNEKPVGTKKLTKSFGWETFDSFLQHDVQELCRVLLDNLESKMKGTPVEGTIPGLFEGKMKSYIRCKNVEFESKREEAFYDIQLNVKGNKDIIESFRNYVKVETLEGDNKYDAGDLGLQDAEKGVKFLKLPPVLHLQLMRFQYDPHLDQNVKINDHFEFPERLDLEEFLEEAESTPAVYILHAVLVHSGDFHGGHYVVFINPKGNGKWCKFDDDVVSRSTKNEAINSNYGGSHDGVDMHQRSTNAYMLVYVRESCIAATLQAVDKENIPQHLVQRLSEEQEADTLKKKEKNEAHLYMNVHIIRQDCLECHTGAGYYDFEKADKLFVKYRVQKDKKYKDFYATVAKDFNLKAQHDFRLWPLVIQEDNWLKMNDVCFYDLELCQVVCKVKHNLATYVRDSNEPLYLFMETYDFANGQTKLADFDTSDSLLAFFKFYDHRRSLIRYCGHLVLNRTLTTFPSLSHMLCKLASLPPNTPLTLFEESKPADVCTLFKGEELNDDLSNGCLVVFQEKIGSTTNANALLSVSTDNVDFHSTVAQYYKDLSNRIELELIDKSTLEQPCQESFKITASLRWTYERLVNLLAHRFDCSPLHLQLYRSHQYRDAPNSAVKYNPDCQIREIVPIQAPPYKSGTAHYKIYYQKIPISIDELEKKLMIKTVFMDLQMKQAELTVYLDKDAKVKAFVDQVRCQLDYPLEKLNRLRVVTVLNNRLNSLVSLENSAQDTIFSSTYQIRVEEMPDDQLTLDSKCECLLPVAHFHKEPPNTFGIPFLLKIRNGEQFSSVRTRIQRLLDVSDKEFEKYKFSLCNNTRVIRQYDTDDLCINLTETQFHQQLTSLISQPWLGLDHVNKAAKGRGSHPLERAIVIHN